MMLGEKEKPVIQQGAYTVIKSHVKNANTHHPLSLTLSQHFLSEQLLSEQTTHTLNPYHNH